MPLASLDLEEGREMQIFPVTDGARWVLKALMQMPLASARDLATGGGREAAGIYRSLWELVGENLVCLERMGWSRRAQERWWVSEEALRRLWEYSTGWNTEHGRCRLLEMLPRVEWFYRVVGDIRGVGRIREFQWIEGMALDAAARFDFGWVGLFWSGLWESERHLIWRLEHLADDLALISASKEQPWPGLLCFVVTDQWQRELVYRAVQLYRLTDRVGIWCVADGSVSGVQDIQPSRGWIWTSVLEGNDGNWPFEQRLADSFSGQTDCRVMGTALSVVAEWPGVWAQTASFLGQEGNWRLSRSLKWLEQDKVISKQGNRYRPTNRGVWYLSRRDGVRFNESVVRSGQLGKGADRIQRHEDGVMRLMGEFALAKCPVAAGWRSWEHLGSSGGIAPDGMVYLSESPFGPGWCYVEYERSARRRARIAKKLRGYGSERRQDRFPLLLVCWDDQAEQLFSEEAGSLPVLTTTMARLKQFGATKNIHCWSMSGRGVLLA